MISSSGHEPPSEQTIRPSSIARSRSSTVVPLRGDLEQLPLRVRRGRRGPPGPSTASSTSRPRSPRTAPRAESPSDTSTRSSGSAELLRRDLRHRRPRAGADVLHRRHDGARPSAPSRTHAYGAGRRRRTRSGSPCRRRASTRPSTAGAHLVPALPVRLGAAVALDQVLRRERALVDRVGVGVVAPAQLQRVDVELRRQLVEQALEPERPLDEPGRAEGRHRRHVQLRAVLRPSARSSQA